MKKDNVFEEIVKISKEEFQNAINKAFENKKSNIKMDGFRKGKVPKDVYFKNKFCIFFGEVFLYAIHLHTPFSDLSI